MMRPSRRVHRSTRTRGRFPGILLLCTAAVALLLSCGDDPQPAVPGTTEAAAPPPTDTTGTTEAAAPPSTDTTEPEAPDTTGTTEAAAPPPTDTTEPEAPDTARRLEIDGETTWQEVFDTFATSERSCSREAVGEERLRSLLEQRVLESDMDGGEWSLLSCLEPRDAESLLLSVLIAGIEWDEGLVLDADQRACLGESTSGIDWAALGDTEDPAAFGDLISGAMNCLPDLFLTNMLDEMGIRPDELSAEQTACLQEWMSGIDWAALGDAEDPAAFGDLISGAVNCLPDLFLTAMLDEMGIRPDELSAEQTACLQEWMSGIDWAALGDTEDPAAFAGLISGAVNCLPDLFLTAMLDEMGIRPDELSAEQTACLQEWMSGLDWTALEDDPTALAALAVGPLSCLADEDADDHADDHANLQSGASAAAVGEPTGGTLDYDGDVDVFAFEAQQGQIYEIHVTPGTLEDPTLELSDADGAFLDYNDDYGDSLASRLAWPAPETGDYYLAVGGYGTGSYTLTVTPIDITDDHANLQHGATIAAVGEPAEGTLDYDGDVDVFAFEAQQGRIYDIHITLGTLEDSVLDLWDAEGFELAYNDDDGYSPASRLTWQAPETDYYDLAVGGYGTGSYTLTVTLTDITDDHANQQDGATIAAVGEPAEGTLDYDDDIDYFAFEAREGQIYDIRVALGTLEDSVLDLWDADGFYLASNDDDGDSLASRLIWRAPASGDYYVSVGGFGTRTGSYTLTVILSDITDDHTNLHIGATAAAVGEPAEGTLNYDDDVDVFVFEARLGQIYEIHVIPGTLEDPTLELSDADGLVLDYNDDSADSLASRLDWTAQETGDYYLTVGGYGTGSYTLTIGSAPSS